MPNHVTNKIVFSAEYAEKIFAETSIDGNFNFKTLVPQPPHVYQGGLGELEEEDFPINWLSWNRENWGTKWNCYDTKYSINGENAEILFDTAWSAPYPVIVAFANRFQIPFTHKYFDEGHNFWGTERWVFADGYACRAGKFYSRDEDKQALCIELKGYDPEAEDEA